MFDKNRWDSFSKSHPFGNIFQTPEMYEVYEKTTNYEPLLISLTNSNGDIEGVLLALIQKEHSGLIGFFTCRSIIIGGPLVLDNRLDLLDKILKKYKENIRNKVIYTQIRNLFDWEGAKDIFIKNGFFYEPHLDIIFNLHENFETLKKNINKNKRRNVTKSLNKGLKFQVIELKEDIEVVIRLVYSTYNKIKLPLPNDSFFYSAIDVLKAKGYLKFFAARKDNIIIGGRLELVYNGKIYDWYAGSDPVYSNLYPNDFLPYHILKWGCENGLTTFDFGGAGKPNKPYGVREHKLRFGGNLVEFGRYEHVHKKILFTIGKIGLKFYKYFYGLQQRR